MENQHRKIKGYRELNENEISLMNRIKQLGNDYDDLLKQLELTLHNTELDVKRTNFVTGQYIDIEAAREYDKANPFAWLMRARQSGAESIMFAVRAVARPTTF